MPFVCPKCGASFPKNQGLQKHLARKRPCTPILDEDQGAQQGNPNRCRYCGRAYSRSDNLVRHLKVCKIANSDEGMEKLMEHTLQRQLATKVDVLEARVVAQSAQMAAQSAQMARLASLLEQQMGAGSALPAALVGAAQTVNLGPVTNTVNTTNIAQVNQQIFIRPWDGAPADRINVTLDAIAAAFSENARLREYCRLGDTEKTDPKVAPPYVLEMLMDLVKRAHADPTARNVYLNPKRADQALVCLKTGRWEVVQLAEATRLLFDGVVVSIHRATLSYETLQQLPQEAQNAMAMAGLVYRDEPEEYAKRAKGPMAAHLSNTAPTSAATAAPVSIAVSSGPPVSATPIATPARAAPGEPQEVGVGAPEAAQPPRGTRPAPSRPKEEKHFTQTEAAALLRAHRPPEVGEVDPAFIKRLAREAGVDAGRVVRKLWEAAEDRLLSGDDDQTARAVCSVYDENPDQCDRSPRGACVF
jgi:hypothetical protein